MIDPTARIHPNTAIAADVKVGPWSVICESVEIGEGTEIGANVVIKGPTRIGCNNRIFPFCSIGDDPQDKKFTGEQDSRLEIGNDNTIREYCSINRGTSHGGGVTRLGDDNWIMAYCHIAHDCQVGDHTIFANNATLAGHVEIHDFVILGGFVGVHQFCRMGESSFAAIAAIIVKDVPPFVIVGGNTARVRSINREGLKRRGFDRERVSVLKRAYKTVYRRGLTLSDALREIDSIDDSTTELECFTSFIKESERGIVR